MLFYIKHVICIKIILDKQIYIQFKCYVKIMLYQYKIN